MAYGVIMLYHLHMPSYFGGHLLNIPNLSAVLLEHFLDIVFFYYS